MSCWKHAGNIHNISLSLLPLNMFISCTIDDNNNTYRMSVVEIPVVSDDQISREIRTSGNAAYWLQ